jgi:glycosyl transferase, family 25
VLLKKGYVINLDIRADRWQRMSSQLKDYSLAHFERFSAVSAHSLDIKNLPINFVTSISQKLKKGTEKQNVEYCIKATWGCLQSHLGIIQKAHNDHLETVVILEDDCELEPYFKEVMQGVVDQLQTLDWDIIYLGGNLHRKSKVTKVSKNLLKGHGITLAHAMIINKTVY